MLTNIQYRDIPKTDSLENFLKTETEGAIFDFLKKDSGAELHVKVEMARHRNDTRKPIFVCKVLFKSSRDQKWLRIGKENENFYSCVHETAMTLKKRLGKLSDQINKKQRRGEGASRAA